METVRELASTVLDENEHSRQQPEDELLLLRERDGRRYGDSCHKAMPNVRVREKSQQKAAGGLLRQRERDGQE